MISPEPSLTVRVQGSGVLGVRRLERAGMTDSPDTTKTGGRRSARPVGFGCPRLRAPALCISTTVDDGSQYAAVDRGPTVAARQARLNSRSEVSTSVPFAICAKGATIPGVARGGEEFANGVLPWRHFRNSSTLI